MDRTVLSDYLIQWESPDSFVYRFWCPGCEEGHSFTVMKDGKKTAWGSGGWEFNGNSTRPTFAPSLLYPSKGTRCHLYLREGRIEFLTDCGHPLAGQIVDMVKYPKEFL